VPITQSQADALKWLKDHNGDGCFDRNGVVLSAGESAPVMRSTWNALRDAGYVEFYRNRVGGQTRLRLTALGSKP
jgi:hypothetical protein